jgi:hypothetical protein
MEHEDVQKGLRLLGWCADSRPTADEFRGLEELAEIALQLNVNGTLTDAIRNDMALQAFHLFDFQVMNPDERALMAGVLYLRSNYLRDSVRIVDEATLCYYRGYYAASLALLFVITEQCLLRICNWTQGSPKPSFKTLINAPLQLQNLDRGQEAVEVLNIIYDRYQQPGDAAFGFNRHAVHHGMRGFSSMDQMNCVRTFLLLDTIVFAEGIRRGFAGTDEGSRIRERSGIYSSVVSFGKEMILIRPGDERLPMS